MQRDLRRNENILSVSGVTVIFFGVWTAIKLVLYFSLSEDGFRAIPRGAEGQLERLMLTAILVLFIARRAWGRKKAAAILFWRC